MNTSSLLRWVIASIILFSFINPNVLNAQEIKKVTGAKGVGIMAGKVTPTEAQREALNQAKIEALRLAGVTEQLQSYQTLFKSETNNDFSEFFSSDVQAELQGAVKDYAIVKEERKADGAVFLIEITIDATVVLYDAKPDPTFNVRVAGVKGIYENGEMLTFEVFSSQSCFLHIFAITDLETSLMYPNEWEEMKEIPANIKTSFPFGNVNYELEKKEKGVELNRVVFVFTKQPTRYLNFSKEGQITNSEDIFSWVYGLMPDQRKVDYQVFTIR